MAEQGAAPSFDVLVPGAFHVPDPGDDQDGPYLLGGYCANSDLTVFPKMTLCPRCHQEMEVRPIGRRGRLFSFTIAHVAPEGFNAPYFQAFVEVPEGPRVFALISDDVPVKEGFLREGMPMELVVEPVRHKADGTPILTYKYRPVESEGKDE